MLQGGKENRSLGHDTLAACAEPRIAASHLATHQFLTRGANMQRLLSGKAGKAFLVLVPNGMLMKLIMALGQHSVGKMKMDCLQFVLYLQSMLVI